MPNFSNEQFIPRISLSSSSTTADPGRFDGAYIKALNIDIGVSENPTSINVGLINELGRYRDYGTQSSDGSSSLNYLDPYNLQIGNNLNIWCYLVGQKKSISSDGKTTELEFVDGSHILDRVFVGGIGVHTLRDQFWTSTIAQTEIPVTCPPCYTDNIIGIPDPNATELVTATSVVPTPAGKIAVNSAFTQRNLRQSNLLGIGNNREGGYIFLGDEKFTRTSCDLADVDYSFQQLIDACNNMDIEINIGDRSKSPNGVSTLRKSYWGTLRSVLKSWCADFGISFVYDYTRLKPTVREISLSNATLTSDLETIAAEAKLIRAGDTKLVEKIDETKTVKGSFKNNVITTYKRRKTPRNFEKNTFYGTAYKCFQTEDVLTTEARSYRTVGQFNQCCTLAKYDQSIRTLFLTWLAGNNWLGGLGNGLMYRALGFNATAAIASDLQEEIIDECLDTETYRAITANFQAPGIDGFDMILGSYSEDVASKHAEFEKSFAEDFLGKYFYTNIDSFADEKFGGFQQCFTGTDWRYEIESAISPLPMDIPTSTAGLNSTSLSARLFNQAKLPFHKNLWGPIPINPWKGYDWFSDSRIKIYQRSDAPWSRTQEQAENVFKEKTDKGIIDLALPFLPRFQKIQGMIETRLRGRFGGTSIPLPETIDGIKEKTVPCILIAPKPARIGQILDISEYYSAQNPNETPYFFNKGKGMGNKVDCQGSTLCELQEAMDKEICKPERSCPNYSSISPSSVTPDNAVGKIYAAQDNQPFPEGVISTEGAAFSVLFMPPVAAGQVFGPARGGGRFTIVGPAGTFPNINDLYLANYKENVKSTFYVPKIEQFLGDEELSPPGSVSEVKITLNNVSSNDPFFAGKDANGKNTVITKVYLNGYGFLTLEEYHNFIKGLDVQTNLNNNIKYDLNITFANLDFGNLSTYLQPKYGLSKLSCAIDSQGISTNASWANRPATAPSTDLFTQEVAPQIIAQQNIF